MEEKTTVTRYLVIRVEGYVPSGTDDQEIDNVMNNVDYTIRACEGDEFRVTDTEIVACCDLEEIEKVL
jgi:hypothetical protein